MPYPLSEEDVLELPDGGARRSVMIFFVMYAFTGACIWEAFLPFMMSLSVIIPRSAPLSSTTGAPVRLPDSRNFEASSSVHV